MEIIYILVSFFAYYSMDIKYSGISSIFSLDMKKYSKEFYSSLPHNVRDTITSKKAVAQKQDICQVNVMHSWSRKQVCFSTHLIVWETKGNKAIVSYGV